MRLLLQDLTERRRGHRNVSEEELEHAMGQMDADGNGEVRGSRPRDVAAPARTVACAVSHGPTCC